jgi:hypothetical protein
MYLPQPHHPLMSRYDFFLLDYRLFPGPSLLTSRSIATLQLRSVTVYTEEEILTP